MKRLVLAAAALWTGRWLALQLAAYAGRKLPRGPAPKESKRAPGHMPGPFDR